MSRLDRSPLGVPVSTRAPAQTATVTGQDLRRMMWQGPFEGDPIPWLPRLITAAAGGQREFVGEYIQLTQRTSDDQIAEGMRCSVERSGQVAARTEAGLYAAAGELNPAIRQQVVQDFSTSLHLCRTWDVPPADPTSLTPVTSDHPVLLLSGEFDPGTPAAHAEIAADTLTHATSVVLPGLGHTDSLVTRCGQRLRAAFLDNPGAMLDTSCVAAMPELEFVVP